MVVTEKEDNQYKIKFLIDSKRNDARVEISFLIDSEIVYKEIIKILKGWKNKQGLSVLEQEIKRKLDVYPISESTRIAPFQVKLREDLSNKEILRDTAERNTIYIKRVNLNKTRNLFTNYFQRESAEGLSPTLNQDTKDTNSKAWKLEQQEGPDTDKKVLDRSAEDVIDFEKIMEEAKKKIGISNWQRTESAKRRERERQSQSRRQITLKHLPQKKLIADSDDSSEEKADNRKPTIKEAKTSNTSTRGLIAPINKLTIEKGTDQGSVDASSRKINLRVLPLKPELRNPQTPGFAPRSLEQLMSPKFQESIKAKMLTFKVLNNQNRSPNKSIGDITPSLLEPRLTTPSSLMMPSTRTTGRILSKRALTVKGPVATLSNS